MEVLLNILKNATRSPLTTAIGIVMILASLFCVFYLPISWDWDKAAPGLTMGFILIFLPDPKKPVKGMIVVILLGATILLVTLLGCKRLPSPSYQFTKEVSDSTSIKTVIRDVLVSVPGATVVLTMTGPCANLITEGINKGKFKPTFYEKKNQHTVLKRTTDSLGNETIDCECLAYKTTIQAKDSVIYRLRKEINSTKVTTTVHQPKWYDMAARFWALISVIAVGLFIYLKLKP